MHASILKLIPKTIKVNTHKKGLALYLASIFLLFSVSGTARGETLSPEEYLALVRDSVERLEHGTGMIQIEERSRLLDRFPAGLKILDGNGGVLRVDRTPFLGGEPWAQTSSDNREQLIIHLKALLGQLSLGTDRISSEIPGREESEKLLTDVYKKREFRYLCKGKTAWKEYVEKILGSVRDWLGKQVNNMNYDRNKWFQYTTNGIILMLTLILAVWIIRSFGRANRSPGEKSIISPRPPAGSFEKEWTTLRKDARGKALEGAFREAIRSLFVSVLLEGDRKGWWIYEPEATNREHLARIKGPEQRKTCFGNLIDIYERAWYGLGRPAADEFQDCEECIQRMEEAPL